MLAGGFRTQIAANIAAGGAVGLYALAEKYAGFLPASFRASIMSACERSIGAVLADNAVVLADAIVENVLPVSYTHLGSSIARAKDLVDTAVIALRCV